MKNFFTLGLCLLLGISAHSQTTIYSQNFNTGSAPGWSLNTTDLGGDASMFDNYWTVNNNYLGGTLYYYTFIPNTPDQPSGITGSPESYYLHILSEAAASYYSYSYYGGTSGAILNSNFNADGFSTYFAAMNTPVVTTCYTGVSFSFWWVCQGDATAYGKVYYRTSTTGAWTAVPGGPATYFGSSGWALQTITNVAFDNQPFLEFGFQFTQDLSGGDPAFSVDDIKVTGTPAVAPAASFSTTATTICQDSSITYTNTSTGTIDSIVWAMPGMSIATPHANPLTLPFTAYGTDTMHLYVYSCHISDTVTHVDTVKKAPHPTITHGTGAAHHLSIPITGYSYIQWQTSTGTNITGATSGSYTYGVSGTYMVLVDSTNGCRGSDVFTTSNVGISNVTGSENNYWITPASDGSVAVHASVNLTEGLTINVYDVSGRQLQEEQWPAGTDTRQLNEIAGPPGTYLFKLSNANTSQILKWIKQ